MENTKKTVSVAIDFKTEEEFIIEPDPNDEWDWGNVRKTHEIEGFKTVTRGSIFDFILPFPIRDEPYYLVHVSYNTGDSFGSSENEICFMDLLEDRKDAEYLKKQIEKNAKDDNILSITIKYPKSKITKTLSTGTWKGYFESFNSVTVEAIDCLNKK